MYCTDFNVPPWKVRFTSICCLSVGRLRSATKFDSVFSRISAPDVFNCFTTSARGVSRTKAASVSTLRWQDATASNRTMLNVAVSFCMGARNWLYVAAPYVCVQVDSVSTGRQDERFLAFAAFGAILRPVKNGHRIVLGLFVAAVTGVSCWQTLRQHEPIYQGKKLSAWLEQYTGNGGPVPRNPSESARAEAAKAVRHIGTNGIPCLLRMAAAEDPPAKKWLLRLPTPKKLAGYLFSQPLFFRWAAKSGLEPMNAAAGFRLLGPDAQSAVPRLVHIMRNGKNSMARLHAVSGLGAIGPAAEEAVPALIDNLKDPFNELRDRTVAALFEIAFDKDNGVFRQECSRIMVPQLGAILIDPKTDALRVIRLLSDVGPDAKAALPAIIPFQESTNADIRTAAKKARERIETGR